MRMWRRLEPPLPLRSAAWMSGLLTSCIGFAIDVKGTLNLVFAASSSRAAALLGAAPPENRLLEGLGLAGPAMGLLTIIYFPLGTRLGLFATYLTLSGAFRAISSWFDEPRGDPLLSTAHWVVTTLLENNRRTRARLAREKLEGPETPDMLRTGEWAGLQGADYIVLAARRKPEWSAGAIIMTSSEWYRLGFPFDIDTPAGLRHAYPLTIMETVEVVRRGIQYELPMLSGVQPQRTPRTQRKT